METAALVEIHLSARPDAGPAVFGLQARSMYGHLLAALGAHGASPRDVVAEKIFLADIGAPAKELAGIRREFYDGGGGESLHPAASCVWQPPANAARLCEIQTLVWRAPDGTGLASHDVERLPEGATGRMVEAGGARHVFLSGLGTGASRRPGLARRTSSLLRRAEAALRREGLSFRDVVRTWFHVADIERDYAALNRGRRRFFRSRRVDPPPASTGIGGVPWPGGGACGLDLRAVAGAGRRQVRAFGAPTMNEAASYGSDFSRGMRVDLEDRSVLYVSGTASIDAEGGVVHPGRIAGQVDRMLVNIEALLAGQGAAYDDVVSAVTYLKRPEHVEVFREVAARRGFPGRVPNTVCRADICRPGWLCEMEVTAVLV